MTYQVINASLLLPQHRQRAYFVGIRQDLKAECAAFRWPRIPVLQRPVKYILEPESAVQDCYLTPHQWGKILGNAHYQKDPSRRMVRLGGVARTLTSSYKSGFYMYSEFVPPPKEGSEPRFWSPREAARIMGFPETFTLGACKNLGRSYHQLGNAVCPPIIAAIGGCLNRALQQRPAPVGTDGTDLAPALDLVLQGCPASMHVSDDPTTASLLGTSRGVSAPTPAAV